MKCSKCNTNMLLLFTSYVCDVCNPPKSNGSVLKNNTQQSRSEQNQVYVGYFPAHTRYTYKELLRVRITIFSSEKDALSCFIDTSNLAVRKVEATTPLKYGVRYTLDKIDCVEASRVKLIPW